MVNQEQTSLSWLDEEINSSVFSDRRHTSRFKSLMQKFWRGMGNSLPFATDMIPFSYGSLTDAVKFLNLRTQMHTKPTIDSVHSIDLNQYKCAFYPENKH